MSIRRKAKNYKSYIFIAVIIGVIFIGGVSLQSGYSVGNVWDADVQVKAVGWNGNTYERTALGAVDKNTPNSVIVDPDGNPNKDITSMNSPGLDPAIEWNVGSLFHVDKFGDITSDTQPKDDYTEDGVRYLVYYFGFSFSVITRSSHPDINGEVFNFDFYGQDLLEVFEYPEFASTNINGEAGIIISNVWDDVPSQCGVEQIKLKDTRMYYTMASAGDYPSDISEFNYDYDWLEYSNPGYIGDPSIDYRYPGFAQKFQGVADLGDLTMRPGGEYAPVIGWWNDWTGGSFNVWDVELIMDMYCKVVISYELSADVNGYLAQRLDIGWPTNPIALDIWAAFLQLLGDFFGAIAALLGFDNPLMGLAIVVGGVFGIIILWKLISRRRAMRIY